MLRGLRTVVYPVEDLARARDWLTDLLGHPPYFDQPFYVGFDVGGYELGLVPDADGQPTAYWGVDDLDAAVERAVESGATVRDSIKDVGEGIRVAAVLRPDGAPLGLIENPHFRVPGVEAITVVDGDAKLAVAGDDLSDRAIVQEATVAAPPEEVWARWTTAEGLARWLVPAARVELRIGGPYELLFDADAPEGSQGSEGCTVLSFLPGRMLSFTWNAPPSLPRTRRQRTWVVLELEPVDGGTRLRLTHTGWPERAWSEAGSEWPRTFAYFERAWAGVMRALAEHVGGGLEA